VIGEVASCLIVVIFKITAVMKIETDIIGRIVASLTVRGVIMFVETFKLLILSVSVFHITLIDNF
jgi:hypothetical protein